MGAAAGWWRGGAWGWWEAGLIRRIGAACARASRAGVGKRGSQEVIECSKKLK